MENEIARRVARGNMPLTLRQLQDQLQALGYALDRSLDCRCTYTDENGQEWFLWQDGDLFACRQ